MKNSTPARCLECRGTAKLATIGYLSGKREPGEDQLTRLEISLRWALVQAVLARMLAYGENSH